MTESPYYPYPPRPGIQTEQIDFDPETERILSDDELENVLRFEHQLYALTLQSDEYPLAEEYRKELDAKGKPVETFENIWRKKVNSVSLDAEYFLTDEGKRLWRQTTGSEITAITLEECKKEISSQDIRTIDSKKLDLLEAKSVGYIEAELTQEFINNGFKGEDLPAPNIVTIYKNPEIILEKAQGFRQLKGYLARIKADILTVDESTPENEAKLLIVDLYRKRANYFIATNYVTAYGLLAQYKNSGNTMHADIIDELEDVLPMFKKDDSSAHIASTLQRIDRYQNGVSENENGKYTWDSPAANALVQKAAQANTEPTTVDRGIYSDIDPEVLKTVKISGKQNGEWLKSYLKSQDLLSTQEEWDSEREGPASDGKWQVIVDGKFKSLAVNDKQRIMKVPDAEKTLAAAIPLDNHETTHVIQHKNKRAIGELAIMQSIGIDNTSEQTEAGGKWQEKLANEILLGRHDLRIAGVGYYKAIKVKEQGGSYGEVVQAYYDDLRASMPNLGQKTAALQAVNRARRIFRAGGFEYAQDTTAITNTQPLSYLEQQLIYENLDEEQRRVLFVGGVTIRNLVRLSQVGLVDPDDISIPKQMPLEFLHDKAKERIEEAKNEQYTKIAQLLRQLETTKKKQ